MLCLVAALLSVPLRDWNAIRAGDIRPNVVFILADDPGRECLECSGGETYHTPNLSRLGAQRMRFECCCATPMCSPARVVLMSGRYSFRN